MPRFFEIISVKDFQRNKIGKIIQILESIMLKQLDYLLKNNEIFS